VVGDAARLVGQPPVLEIRGRIDSTVKIRGFKARSDIKKLGGGGELKKHDFLSSKRWAFDMFDKTSIQPSLDFYHL